jgi:hypothetical protein
MAMATKAEIRAAQQDDANQEMLELGTYLHKARNLAQRLKGRGIDMGALAIDVESIEAAMSAADDAYTLDRVKLP